MNVYILPLGPTFRSVSPTPRVGCSRVRARHASTSSRRGPTVGRSRLSLRPKCKWPRTAHAAIRCDWRQMQASCVPLSQVVAHVSVSKRALSILFAEKITCSATEAGQDLAFAGIERIDCVDVVTVDTWKKSCRHAALRDADFMGEKGFVVTTKNFGIARPSFGAAPFVVEPLSISH